MTLNAMLFAVCAGLALAAGPAGPAVLRGSVLETLDAGDYTYVRIATAGGERWAAVPKTALKVGQDVRVQGSALMEDFDSPRLKRRFSRVLFGVLEPAAPAAVTKATGAEAKTIAEVFAQKAALKGKTVAVRGKVVKYNAKIMGSNWLHLRDGSGSDKTKDNDLTVTTADSAAVGEVVTIRGPLILGKDLGAGYYFPVLIEGGRIVR